MRIRPAIAYAPDDGGGAAAPPAAGAPPADVSLFDDAPPGGDQAAANPAGTPPATGAADPAKPGRPEWVPEQFWDADAGKVRDQDMAKSWLDLRKQVSRGDHKPPATPDAYTLPAVEGLPEGIVGGEGDTLWPELRKAAHQAGMTQKQMEALATPFLAALAEQAKALPAAPTPEQLKAARDRELAQLGPNGAAVVRDVDGWIRGMHGRGLLTDGELGALRRIGNAEGIRALAKLRELSGEQPIPTTALDDGNMAQADAERLMREGFKENDMAKVERARTTLTQLEKRGQLVVRA